MPTGHARGPWDPGQLHGGAPGALIAEAVQEEGYLVARLTLDFLGAGAARAADRQRAHDASPGAACRWPRPS